MLRERRGYLGQRGTIHAQQSIGVHHQRLVVVLWEELAVDHLPRCQPQVSFR